MTINPALLPSQARLIQVFETEYGVSPGSSGRAYRRFIPPLTPAGIDAMSAIQEVGSAQSTARDTTLIAPDLLAPTLSISAMLSISEIAWLLAMTFGNATTTTGSGADANHALDVYTSGGAIRSSTLEVGTGDLTRVYRGVSVNSLTVPLGKQSGFRQVEAQCVSGRPSETGAGGSPSAPPAPLYIPGWASFLTVGGVAFPITQGTLTYNNDIQRTPETDGQRDPRSAYGGISTLELSLSAILENQAQVAAFDGAMGSSTAIEIEMRPDAAAARRVVWSVPTALIAKPEIAIVEGQQQISLSVMARQTASLPLLTATVVRPTT